MKVCDYLYIYELLNIKLIHLHTQNISVKCIKNWLNVLKIDFDGK